MSTFLYIVHDKLLKGGIVIMMSHLNFKANPVHLALRMIGRHSPRDGNNSGEIFIDFRHFHWLVISKVLFNNNTCIRSIGFQLTWALNQIDYTREEQKLSPSCAFDSTQ